MPCNMIVTTKVAWSEKTDTKLLAKAFEKMGLTVREVGGRIVAVSQATGREVAAYAVKDHMMHISSPFGQAAEFADVDFKKAYSEQVLYRSAALNGFQVQKTGQNKFRMVKNVTF